AACTLLTWLLPNTEQVKPVTNRAGSLRERVGLAMAELKEGWMYIRADHAIFAAIIQWSVAIAVLLMLGVIGPRFLATEVGINPQDLYLILFPGGVGLVVGVVLVSRYAREQNRLRMINYAMVAAGVGLVIFAGLGWMVRFVVGLLKPAADYNTVTA